MQYNVCWNTNNTITEGSVMVWTVLLVVNKVCTCSYVKQLILHAAISCYVVGTPLLYISYCYKLQKWPFYSDIRKGQDTFVKAFRLFTAAYTQTKSTNGYMPTTDRLLPQHGNQALGFVLHMHTQKTIDFGNTYVHCFWISILTFVLWTALNYLRNVLRNTSSASLVAISSVRLCLHERWLCFRTTYGVILKEENTAKHFGPPKSAWSNHSMKR